MCSNLQPSLAGYSQVTSQLLQVLKVQVAYLVIIKINNMLLEACLGRLNLKGKAFLALIKRLKSQVFLATLACSHSRLVHSLEEELKLKQNHYSELLINNNSLLKVAYSE